MRMWLGILEVGTGGRRHCPHFPVCPMSALHGKIERFY